MGAQRRMCQKQGLDAEKLSEKLPCLWYVNSCSCSYCKIPFSLLLLSFIPLFKLYDECRCVVTCAKCNIRYNNVRPLEDYIGRKVLLQHCGSQTGQRFSLLKLFKMHPCHLQHLLSSVEAGVGCILIH